MAVSDTKPSIQPNNDAPLRVTVLHLFILVGVALLPRLILASNATAPARDMLRYVGAAEILDDHTFRDFLKTSPSHPLYPLTLRAARAVDRLVTGNTGPMGWWRAGQVVGIVSSLLFVCLAYLVGREIWPPWIAFWGLVIFAILPRPARYAADVLSDNLHAAIWMASFWLMLVSLRRHSWIASAGAGLLATLAFATRVEALLLPLVFGTSVGVLWLASQVTRRLGPANSPASWRHWFACLAAYSFAFALPVALLMGVSERWTSSHSARGMISDGGPGVETHLKHGEVTSLAGIELIDRRKSHADEQRERDRLIEISGSDWWPQLPALLTALLRFVKELLQETRLWPVLFACWALVDRCHRRKAHWPGVVPAAVAFVGCSVALILLRYKVGFLAGRYLLPVLPFLTMLAVAGIEALRERVSTTKRFFWERCWTDDRFRARRQMAFVAMIGVIALGTSLPDWFQPLHPHRNGHLEAARWLARNSDESDAVFDPSRVSSFFAERRVWTQRPFEKEASLPFAFAVVDPSLVYRTDPSTHAMIARVDREGELIAAFPSRVGGDRVGILLYRVSRSASAIAERGLPR